MSRPKGEDNACIRCRSKRSDWRTVNCRVVEDGTLRRGHDNERGAGEESARAKGAEAVIVDAFNAAEVEAALRQIEGRSSNR
jgi:hypothetical protein